MRIDRRPGRWSRRALLRTALGAGAVVAARSLPMAPGANAATKPGGKVRIWMGATFTKKLDDYIGEVFKEWGGKSGVDVEYEVISGTGRPQRIAAALQGGTPPDIVILYDADVQFYKGNGNLVDVSDVINPLKGQAGGMSQAALSTVAGGGKYWAVPIGLNPWPVHARLDLLEQAKVEYPKTWDEFIETCKKIQKPPELYGYGLTLGRTADTQNNFIHMQWTMGGRMQTKDSKPAFRSEATVRTMKLVSDMFKVHKIIPPGSVSWDDAGNNNAYQSEHAAFIINPTSVMSWLLQNKPDLAKRTGLFLPPAGPAGTFGQLDVWTLGIFTQSKNQEAAKEALQYLIAPSRYQQLIENSEHRWAPIYKQLAHSAYWTKDPLYKAFVQTVDTGREMAYEGAPVPYFGEVLNTRMVADMVQDVVVRDRAPEQALDDFGKKVNGVYAKLRQ